jgi:hypothetical protein
MTPKQQQAEAITEFLLYEVGIAVEQEDIPTMTDGIAAIITDDWISVEDRLPDRIGAYLCQTKAEEVYEPHRHILYWGDGEWYWSINGIGAEEAIVGLIVTHWMPLPEPAKR